MDHAPYCSALWAGWTSPQCWYDWQTLIAGTFAILGAIAVIYQTREARREADQRRDARALACRVMLPHQLSAVCDYSASVAQALAKAHQAAPNGNSTAIAAAWQSPLFPAEVLENLERAIEAIPIKPVIEILADILSEIQILKSRTSQLSGGSSRHQVALNRNIEDYILQAAQLHILAGNVFPFARREMDSVPDSLQWSEVRSKLFMWGIHQSSFPQMYISMDSRAKRNSAFWPDRS